MTAGRLIKILLGVIIIVLLLLGIKGISIYSKVFKPNVSIDGDGISYIYIPTGSGFQDVLSIINEEDFIIDNKSFLWTAKKKNYENHVYSGRYKIRHGMNNNELVNLLRSGRQEPVELTFHNIRFEHELAKTVARQIEPGAEEILELIYNDSIVSELGFNRQTIKGMFIPNTYEFYWNTSARKFLLRMHDEYNEFWNRQRLRKAESLGFTPNEVITLASIVDEETFRDDEMNMIAGVYINRLKKGIRLQADPTVKFAIGDFTVRRVLNKHLHIDSPYNTYRYAGLPPGPISIPSVAAIDAVLNYKNHDYLYFCAKEDFSGYHRFAKTLNQHNKNARLYRQALNRRKILK